VINLYNTKFLWNRAVRSWVIAIPRLKIWGLTSLTPCRIFIVVPLSQSHNAPTYQLAISIFDLMILMCHMLRSVRSEIIFTKFELGLLIRSWIITFFTVDTLCHAVTSDPLTLNVCQRVTVKWSKSVLNLSKIEQSIYAVEFTMI